MPKFSRFSLRSRALVLVLLAILPLLALTLYSYFDRRNRAIREVQRDELVAARNMAITLENLFSNTRQLLMALARLPEVQRRDRAACESLLAGVLGQCPYYAVLLAVDPRGQLIASAPTAPGPVNYADRRWFQEIVQTKALVISEPIIGRFTKKYVYNVAFPILDEAGRLQGAITAGIDLQWLGGLLAKSDFPPTTAIVLTDGSHKVFFRYPEPLKYSGKMLPDFLIKDMTGRDEGLSSGVGLPGDERLFAFVRLSAPWQERWVFFGLPRDWAVGPVNRALGRNLIFLGLVALFAMAAAWYGGGLFIVQPVKRLGTVTERLAAGDLSVRSGPDHPPGELGLLAHAFDQMADSLQRREAESQRLLNLVQEEKEKLTALVNSINDEVWFADTQKKFTLANPSALREFGLDASGDTDVEKFAASLEVYRTDGSLRPTEEAPALIALQGELIRNLEEIIRTPASQELRHRQVSAAPVRDVNGNIIGSVSVVRDITDLKRAEEALRENEERLKLVLQGSSHGFFDWDLVNDSAWLSPSFAEMLGLPRQEAVTSFKEFLEYVHPDDVEMVKASVSDHLEGRLPVFQEEYRLRAGDGWKWVMCRAQVVQRDAQGRPLRMAGTYDDIERRKQAEEALKESEAKYRNLFENMTEEVHFWQLERDEAGGIKTWRLVDANPPTLKTWGRSTINEIKGKTTDEIFGPGSTDHYFPVVQKIITEGVPYAFEDYFPNLDKYFRFTSVPLGDFFITTGTDITNIKKAEAALRESEKRLRSFYESDLMGVIYWNVSGEITDANDRFLEMVGYQRADLTAGRLNWRDMTPSEYLHLNEAAIEELGATGVHGPPIEKEYIRKDGTHLPILTAGRLLDEARGDGVSFVLDITARKQAEEALRESEARLAEAQRIAHVGNWEWDMARNTLNWSDEVYRIFGLAPQEFQPTYADFLSFIHPDDMTAVNRQVEDGVRVGKYGPYDYRIMRRDGSIRFVYAHGETNFNQAGQPLMMLGTVQDITELKQAEAALHRLNEELELRVQRRTADLKKANDLLKKSEEHLRYLASKILTAQEQERKRLAIELHDGLGQSLSALKMYLRAIQRHLPKEVEVIREDFEDAQRLLRETIEETRKISRGLRPTLLENLGLTAAIRYLLEEFGKHHNARITFDTDDIQDLFSLQTAINLFRVCQEAINNIAKHSLATEVSVVFERQDSSVIFCIKDNGVGFDLDQFSQEDLADKGMGLAAMDERLRMIGAHLTIVSQIGMGTEISSSIPYDAK